MRKWHHPYGRKWRRTEEPLESERGEWKSWLKTQHSENEDHGIQSHRFMANRWRNNGNSDRFYFLGFQIIADGDCSHEIKRYLLLANKSYDQPRQHIKKLRHYFTNKGPSSQSYDFSNSHVWMWELDYKESWAPKNWCFWTVVLEKTLESLLDFKEIQLVHPKGNESWIFIGRTDVETKTPILWPPDVKNQIFGKDRDAGKDLRWEEKWVTEDEMVGWHHWHDTHEF